jgi:magnesium-transporting ATPase (P-type)
MMAPSLGTRWRRRHLRVWIGNLPKVSLSLPLVPRLISNESIVGGVLAPNTPSAHQNLQLSIRRRFQFSSALKRMATVSTLPGGRILVSVKGAPETIKGRLSTVPEHYDKTYKWFTRKGSRVLALGTKEMEAMSIEKVE